jgi:hypothetical protein
LVSINKKPVSKIETGFFYIFHYTQKKYLSLTSEKMKRLLFIITIVIACMWSCKNDKAPAAKTLCDSVTYTTMVKPILSQNCNIAGCHIGGTGGGNIDLRTYDKAKDAAQNNEMKKAINWQLDLDKNMPQGAAKLSQRNIDIIECWMNKGFPE